MFHPRPSSASNNPPRHGQEEDNERYVEFLMKLYLLLNQAAYAVVAFPIGTVLSIAPIFLNTHKRIPLQTIGYMMAGGELLGIVGMKTAELSKSGWIVRRPHDLHLINAAIAISLTMIPLWPFRLSVFSGLAMMAVQTFNSVSKPVIAENLHRLAILRGANPSRVFAQANMWRRIGNGVVGAATPLVYAVAPDLSFYVVASLIFIFLVLLVGVAILIQQQVSEDGTSTITSNKEKGARLKRPMSPISSLKGMSQNFHDSTTSGMSLVDILEDYDDSSDDNDVSVPENQNECIDMTNEIDVEQAIKREETTSIKSTSLQKVDGGSSSTTDHEEVEEQKKTPSSSFDPRDLLYFPIVHAFPFWDAAISRLPFAFLTIAIANDYNIFLASGILFGYQVGRAVSQFVQIWKCTPLVCYLLNGVTLASYTVLVTYIEVLPNGDLWYVPFVFAGFAETLPIQQLYLMKLFHCNKSIVGETEEDPNVRRAVKASHTATGVGSMAAFLAASQIYSRYNIHGVAYLGLSIQACKVVTNVLIDWLLWKTNDDDSGHH